MNWKQIRNRGHLPHWEEESGVYFVTFRLADSLPRAVIAEMEKELASAKAPSLGRAKQLEEYL